MSTVDRERAVIVPPLLAGERLDAVTFHTRYSAMPPSARAELIDGVVYMPSPVYPDHGFEGFNVGAWLGYYASQTAGLRGEDNTSTRLDPSTEVQPDHNLRIKPEYGGQSGTAREHIIGAPELIVEISRATRRIDLGPKKVQYERAGVREYLVVAIDPDEIYWFVLRDGAFERMQPGADRLYRSEVFPGLWLDPSACFEGDLARIIEAVNLGLATAEHRGFVERLARQRAGREA